MFKNANNSQKTSMTQVFSKFPQAQSPDINSITAYGNTPSITKGRPAIGLEMHNHGRVSQAWENNSLQDMKISSNHSSTIKDLFLKLEHNEESMMRYEKTCEAFVFHTVQIFGKIPNVIIDHEEVRKKVEKKLQQKYVEEKSLHLSHDSIGDISDHLMSELVKDRVVISRDGKPISQEQVTAWQKELKSNLIIYLEAENILPKQKEKENSTSETAGLSLNNFRWKAVKESSQYKDQIGSTEHIIKAVFSNQLKSLESLLDLSKEIREKREEKKLEEFEHKQHVIKLIEFKKMELKEERVKEDIHKLAEHGDIIAKSILNNEFRDE